MNPNCLYKWIASSRRSLTRIINALSNIKKRNSKSSLYNTIHGQKPYAIALHGLVNEMDKPFQLIANGLKKVRVSGSSHIWRLSSILNILGHCNVVFARSEVKRTLQRKLWETAFRDNDLFQKWCEGNYFVRCIWVYVELIITQEEEERCVSSYLHGVHQAPYGSSKSYMF